MTLDTQIRHFIAQTQKFKRRVKRKTILSDYDIKEADLIRNQRYLLTGQLFHLNNLVEEAYKGI